MAEETRGRGEFGRGGYQKRQPQWRDRDGERSERGDRGGYQRRDDRRGGFRDDRRDGDRGGFQRRDNNRRDFGSRDDRRGGFRDRGRGGAPRNDGAYKNYSSTDEYVSPNGNEPTIPAGVSADELDRDALRALTTLSGPNRDIVARHLVMAGQLIDLEPFMCKVRVLAKREVRQIIDR